ncbi:DUF6483 family protein [Paenibacillus sedimenti]|uniref:Uncharacterized protein n=1 Tax=Paenibacillus sedimenti TaxID=2770274 RepID=A0A926KQV5_9BACL|nr:DUF6483 family protein [Paenibacillus sedimenti]MBD0381633.1 hypothetical protein [Paenibacillus sedimenti]
MFKRDYFMRQLEQLTVTLHRILFNKEHIPLSQAQPLLDEASRHLLGLNVKSLQALSSKDILELLTFQGHLDPAKTMVISDLFTGQGDLLRQHEEAEDDAGANEAYRSYLKSLDLLLLFALPPNTDDPDVAREAAQRITQCLERLQPWVLPADMKLRLFDYYDLQGDFAKAEDMLFHYMEDHKELVSIAVAQGVLFYERLLGKDEDQLQAGNFSREEVQEGLCLLKEKLS